MKEDNKKMVTYINFMLFMYWNQLLKMKRNIRMAC